MFVAITIGYGTGIIYNHQMYELGDITELAASSIIANYNYEPVINASLSCNGFEENRKKNFYSISYDVDKTNKTINEIIETSESSLFNRIWNRT